MKTPFAVLSVLFFLALLPAGPAAAQCQLGVPVIKVGVQGAASGPHSDYGRQIEMGATMAIEEINAAGGIAGCKIEIKFMDDENKAATGVKNARYLVTDWGAHFMVGTDSSGVAMALGPVLAELSPGERPGLPGRHHRGPDLQGPDGHQALGQHRGGLRVRLHVMEPLQGDIEEVPPRRGIRGIGLGAVPDAGFFASHLGRDGAKT
ncbi:MAG: ABC transporter substrate-binding protein [Betaproteobacteria bacterium]|nr:ABC transporter substrate-binding protein [Betaproteobacteria bacterium]